MLVGLFVAPVAVACSCAPSPTPHACPALPDASRNEGAVFIGTVVESLPKSWEDFFALAERLNGKKFSFPIDPEAINQKLTPVQEREWLSAMKRATVFLWRDRLTPAQLEQIQQATSMEAIERVERAVGGFRRRVRLKVSERFTGPNVPEFEVFTGMSNGDCGVDFQDGEEYAVSAWRDKDGRWNTSVCSGTFLAAADPESVKRLRAWKRGENLAPRVYGWISGYAPQEGRPADLKRMAAVPIRLLGDCGQFDSVTDLDGRFVFEGLQSCTYRLQAQLTGWSSTGPIEPIDLSKSPCAKVNIYLKPADAK